MPQVYPPNHLSRSESKAALESREENAGNRTAPDDATLTAYVAKYWAQYRQVIDRFFPLLAPALPLYVNSPFASSVVRIGTNGVIIAHRPAERESVEVLSLEQFDPPLEPGWTIFTLQDRLQAPVLSFDFQGRPHDARQAEVEGTRAALSDALTIFWQSLDPSDFSHVCKELLRVEGLVLDAEALVADRRVDALADVLLSEPGGFRREERWAFEFRHYQQERVSASYIRELEAAIERSEHDIDVFCVITSGDLTSIGNRVAVGNPRLRLWDRVVLDRLVHERLELLSRFFTEYAAALETVAREFGNFGATPSRLDEFTARLKACPKGEEAFAEYEALGAEIWRYLFSESLGEPKIQPRTLDGTQRRDVVFRNERRSKLFARIAERFDADFVVVDFKNYSAPVGGAVLDSVAKYANKALGRFICIVAREGAAAAAPAVQQRIFRDESTVVLVISDRQLLEMVARKEAGESPEDVLEDLLDEMLVRF